MLFNDKSDYFDSDHEAVQSAETSGTPSDASTDPSAEEVMDEMRPTTIDTHEVRPRRHRFRKFMLWTLFFVVVAGAIAFYIRYCNPYAIDARETGLIVNVEKRGILFKTYEADVSAFASVRNSNGQYARQKFSFANDSLAHIAQRFQQTGQPVELVYSRYFATLPWRGASVRVVTGISAYQSAKVVP